MFGITHLESMFCLQRNQVCTSRNWKPSQREIISKDAGPFLKFSFFIRCFSHIFAIANKLPGFSISRRASVEDFFNVYIFWNVNTYVSINGYLLKYNYLLCCLKFRFYCLTCSAMLIWIQLISQKLSQRSWNQARNQRLRSHENI